ncbi:MAG TPA: hypothetical protein VN228_07380 [Pyrinomonadaceae bacterium]|nr:hypothetical protein [Pyrinomonadaceae bacterium]
MSKVRSFSAAEAGAAPAKSVPLSGTLKKVGAYLGVAAVAFLLGLLPMWMKAGEAASQRDAAQRELRLSQLHGTLASAAIDARRGDYEPARQTASDFFTTLRGQLDAGADSALTARQREATAPLLARRDHLITLLARSDPAAAEQLTDLYVSYRKAVNEVRAD